MLIVIKTKQQLKKAYICSKFVIAKISKNPRVPRCLIQEKKALAWISARKMIPLKFKGKTAKPR